jgi:hypothetical protein
MKTRCAWLLAGPLIELSVTNLAGRGGNCLPRHGQGAVVKFYDKFSFRFVALAEVSN